MMSNFHTFTVFRPIVVILGATGTGKSKLAINIAKKFRGEIISVDSMQVYKGLDILTNKVTEEEENLVPHHMIGFLDPFVEYKVCDFQSDALCLINKLHENNKLPVLVGGTHYYLESILWKVLVRSSSESGDYSENEEISDMCSANDSCDNLRKKFRKSNEDCFLNSESDKNISEVQFNFKDFSNEELYNKLENVDPDRAETLHPNNRRKIKRSLELFMKTGLTHTELLARNRNVEGGDSFGGGRRFDNVAVLWVNCQKDVLFKRLDDRVDVMLEQGLLRELEEFHEEFNNVRLQETQKPPQEGAEIEETQVDRHYEHGIFQSIGLKQFHSYLSLNADDKKTSEGETIFENCVKAMKAKTRKYSTLQIRWIRNRFLIRDRKTYPVYALDASDLSKWKESVQQPAEDIVASILKEEEPHINPTTIDYDPDVNIVKGDKTRHHCDICDRILIGNHQWEVHLKGVKHWKVKKKKEKEELKVNTEYETT